MDGNEGFHRNAHGKYRTGGVVLFPAAFGAVWAFEGCSVGGALLQLCGSALVGGRYDDDSFVSCWFWIRYLPVSANIGEQVNLYSQLRSHRKWILALHDVQERLLYY